MKPTLIPLALVNDHEQFWLGTRFRIYNIGQNIKDQEEDFYEYMLAQVPGESEYLLLTNVRGYKAGAALALVKIDFDSGKVVVTAKELKSCIGIVDTFIVNSTFV